MKIYKISKNESVPANCIAIKLHFDVSTGESSKKVIGHGSGTGCNMEDDDLVLRETATSVTSDTPGKYLTEEGERVKRERPMAVKTPAQPTREKTLDLGLA